MRGAPTRSLRKAKLAVVPPRACTGYVQGMCMCRLGLESASLTSLPPSPSPLLKPHHHVPLPHRARLQTSITLDYNCNLDYTVISITVISITRLHSITLDYTRLQPLRLQFRLQENTEENQTLVISITVIFDYSPTVVSIT